MTKYFLFVLSLLLGWVAIHNYSDVRKRNHFDPTQIDTLITKTEITVTPFQGKGSEYKIEKGSSLRIFSYVRSGADEYLTEDDRGNRFCLDTSIFVNKHLELEHYNKAHRYNIHYKKVDSLFLGKHIDEVVREIGDYYMCNTEKSLYSFPYITVIYPSSRGYGIMLETDRDGMVIHCSKDVDDTGWNLFCFLPFHSYIASWNLLTTTSILNYNDEYDQSALISVIVAFALLCLPFFLFFKSISMFISSRGNLSNEQVDNYVSYFLIVIFPAFYILMMGMLDLLHDIWIIAFFVVSMIFSFLSVNLLNASKGTDRCPKCRRTDAYRTKRTNLKVYPKGSITYWFGFERTGNRSGAYKIDVEKEFLQHTDYRIDGKCTKCKYIYSEEFWEEEKIKIKGCPYCGADKSDIIENITHVHDEYGGSSQKEKNHRMALKDAELTGYGDRVKGDTNFDTQTTHYWNTSFDYSERCAHCGRESSTFHKSYTREYHTSGSGHGVRTGRLE